MSPYQYNSSNELTSTPTTTYTYDKDGELATKVDSTGTTTYNWNTLNRLTSVVLPGSGGTVSFKYDPFGRRIQKSTASATTNYLYDGANVIEEVDNSGNTLARYTQSANIDAPLGELRVATTIYYDADGVGSITSSTGSSGTTSTTYTYDGYGDLTGSTGTITNPLRYTGRELDLETKIYYYRARYYDPAIGRFISEDRIQFLGGGNFYRYAVNNPLRYIDPWGLNTEVIIWNPVDSSGASQFGHASVIINGMSYSWGPAPGRNPMNKCCRAGVMNQQPAGNYLLNNTSFRSGLGYVLNLTAAQENAFANYLSNYRGNYNALSRNCDDPIVSGLANIGIYLNWPSDPLGIGPIVIVPGDLANSLTNTTGLVTDFVPHTPYWWSGTWTGQGRPGMD